jgi:hypothetical protein
MSWYNWSNCGEKKSRNGKKKEKISKSSFCASLENEKEKTPKL